MKTPEEIAREVIEANYGIGTDWEEPNEYGEEGFTRAQAESDIDADEIRGLIEQAIEADRAQTDEVTVSLPSGQIVRVWVGTSDADGSALIQVDTEGKGGNVRIFVNDGDDPVMDENPETGEYQDMAPESDSVDD